MSADSSAPVRRREPGAAEFRAMQKDPEFLDLKKTFRGFAFPMSVAFFLWYMFYVLLAVYAKDWMGTPVFGNVNWGVIMGLLQFVTTFAITWIYVNFANKKIEPKAAAIRERMEG